MDPALKQAATSGNVYFLIKSVSQKDSDYFLTQIAREGENKIIGNIFHLAAWHDQYKFFWEAMRRLPKELVRQLMFEDDDNGWTPLHVAAQEGTKSHAIIISIERDILSRRLQSLQEKEGIIKLIIDFYKSIDEEGAVGKPWLALTPVKMTPLHIALYVKDHENEKCAMELLSLDVELLSNMDSADGQSPLFLAVKNGFAQVAETILKMPSFSDSGLDGSTPLHFAPKCSESVLRLMLEKCPKCLDKFDNRGFSVLHEWAKIGKVWPFKLVLDCDDFPEARTKIFKELVFSVETMKSDTPLHKAAMLKSSEVGEVLIKGYQQQVSSVIIEGEMKESASSAGECLPPWRMINKDGNTPLLLALKEEKNVEFALKLLSLDPTLCQVHNNAGESPFFMAVGPGGERVVEEILRIGEPHFDMIRRNDGTTVLHRLRWVPEQTGIMLLEKYWWIINLADDKRMTALDYAKQANVPWLVRLLTNPSLIKNQPFDWKAACERKEMPAVLAFIDSNRQDLQWICYEENDTPLHHIKLSTSKEYRDFLKIASIGELKNTTDYDGATPLHRALERKDIHFAKALLLDDGVERIIPDHNGTTAMDLLAELCKRNDEWAVMCKHVKVNPYLRTTYIQPGTNLDKMRNTLSVVAALLATITFAAGFTLPGGITRTGEALLAKKAAFLVFLLADVYAMCTSMLVLVFCLIWFMVSESDDMARLLVDRSVFILMQSLYSTLLAFMTGIYTVIADSSLWAAVLIIVMCAVIGILVNWTVLLAVIPSKKIKDRLRLLEEGNAGPPSRKAE